jgi:hypothetical protein
MELWIKFILAVTFINIFGFYIMKNLTTNNNCFLIVSYLFFFTGIIAFFSLIYLHFYTTINVTNVKNIYGILLLSLLNFASYTLLLHAVKYSDNPGYVRAFVGLEITIITLTFAYLYHKSINIYKIFGIISIVIGILLISLS